MATEGISGTRTTGVTVSHTNGNAQNASQASGSERVRAKASASSANSRQVINIDGKNFDRHAPRGTYLNIVA